MPFPAQKVYPPLHPPGLAHTQFPPGPSLTFSRASFNTGSGCARGTGSGCWGHILTGTAVTSDPKEPAGNREEAKDQDRRRGVMLEEVGGWQQRPEPGLRASPPSWQQPYQEISGYRDQPWAARGKGQSMPGGEGTVPRSPPAASPSRNQLGHRS